MDELLRYLRRMAAIEDARNLADHVLLQRFIDRRDEVAFAALVDRYAPLILATGRRLLSSEQDAEDVLQATFLVLVRKAGSIRKQESVGSWLYGIAYRLACKIRASEARRRVRERESATGHPTASPPHTWDDLGAVLDEELQHLPEKYRAPLLLCCLQGKTRDEAAQELGWAIGTVKIRLERGRELLRSRLSRRGIALSTALVASSLASAAVPVRTAATVVAQSMSLAAGRIVDAPVAMELSRGLLREMIAAKVGTLAGVVLAVGFGVVWFALAAGFFSPNAEPTADPNGVGLRRIPEFPPPEPEARAGGVPPPAVARPKAGGTFFALLRAVNPDNRTVTLRFREADRTYPLNESAEIQVDGQPVGVADLVALGSKQRVKSTLTSDETEVLSLAIEGETWNGTLQGMNAVRHTITVHRIAGDMKAGLVTWELSPMAAITIDGNPSQLGELREGLSVSVGLSADGKRVLVLNAVSP